MEPANQSQPVPQPTTSASPNQSNTSRAFTSRRQRKNNLETKSQKPENDDPKKVNVSGFTPYTEQHDLLRAFSKFGTVTVDKMNNKFAILSFSAPKEALAAIQASKKVNVYGEYLTVKPFNPNAMVADAPPKHSPKREFTRSKQKCVIIEPKDIDLSGDFHQQLDNVLASVRLTQEEVANLGGLYYALEQALQEPWPGCKAVPFGSITTGLGIKTSDADCFINVPAQYKNPNVNFVNKAKRVLQQYPDIFAEIISIPRANTPIVKFFHIPTGTNCDVSFKTALGAQNSKLIAFLLHADPRLIPMAVFIKYWAKVHEFSGSGKLTNYALTMLIIFYLQQPPMSILPSVEWLQNDPANDIIVDYWNTGFMNRPEKLPPSSNTSSISELLGGFFEFYCMFNFDEMMICPYLGHPIRKDTFKDIEQVPEQFARYKHNVQNNYAQPMRYNTSICVQDPFEQCHNVASTVSTRVASEIKTYFKFAADIYEKEKHNKCQELIKNILLRKPKIIRGKTNPEYRVTLFSRIIVNIIEPDWKSVVREVMFNIFENILKLKLGKVEEKVNPDSKKEKEKYMGTINKTIWRRKQFNKLYSVMKSDFTERESKITEEILNVDKHSFNLQFQLIVTYCHDPKSAVVSIKMGNGDLEVFKEFGKFFISVMQHWFIHLLKPYSKIIENNTAAKIAETIKTLDSNLDTSNSVDSDDDETTGFSTVQSTEPNQSVSERKHEPNTISDGNSDKIVDDTSDATSGQMQEQ